MNRPGFVEMMQQLEQGKAAAVFVKDLSRLGRNYIEVGRLTEEFFPDHDIRLVAVSDNIDTAEGENELAPIRNLFNEWYARDISKKRRISNKIKGNSGEPMGLPPYGYIKDPNNPKHWVIDEEAAQVVRRIFDMTLEGFGTEQIAAQFEKEGISTLSMGDEMLLNTFSALAQEESQSISMNQRLSIVKRMELWASMWTATPLTDTGWSTRHWLCTSRKLLLCGTFSTCICGVSPSVRLAEN